MRVECAFCCALLIIPICAQTGTYFVPRNRVYASYSQWVVSFTFSLSEVEHEVIEAEQHVQEFQIAATEYFEQ